MQSKQLLILAHLYLFQRLWTATAECLLRADCFCKCPAPTAQPSAAHWHNEQLLTKASADTRAHTHTHTNTHSHINTHQQPKSPLQPSHPPDCTWKTCVLKLSLTKLLQYKYIHQTGSWHFPSTFFFYCLVEEKLFISFFWGFFFEGTMLHFWLCYSIWVVLKWNVLKLPMLMLLLRWIWDPLCISLNASWMLLPFECRMRLTRLRWIIILVVGRKLIKVSDTIYCPAFLAIANFLWCLQWSFWQI